MADKVDTMIEALRAFADGARKLQELGWERKTIEGALDVALEGPAGQLSKPDPIPPLPGLCGGCGICPGWKTAKFGRYARFAEYTWEEMTQGGHEGGRHRILRFALKRAAAGADFADHPFYNRCVVALASYEDTSAYPLKTV